MAFRENREHDRKYHRSHRDRTKGGDLRHRADRRSASPPSRYNSYDHRQYHSPDQAILPLRASPIRKNDFATYKPMFALYLDIQKQLVLEDLSDTEIRGRWKSFVGKWCVFLSHTTNFFTLDIAYRSSRILSSSSISGMFLRKWTLLTSVRNRGELAEGWYDPATLRKATDAASQLGSSYHDSKRSKVSNIRNSQPNKSPMAKSSDEDAPGPSLPEKHDPHRQSLKSSHAGPTIPDLQDLELRKGLSTIVIWRAVVTIVSAFLMLQHYN